jgi:hypothetical protein
MSKRKDRKQVAALYARVTQLAGGAAAGAPEAFADLAAPGELPKLKRFRFQLLHTWMVANLQPCRVADVGGGKGLLTYLLRESGWPATVVDPEPQALPAKYTDPATGRTVRIPATASVPQIAAPFRPELAQQFDLLVALHAHGCTIEVLRAAARFRRQAIVMPCCIVGEPLLPPPGVHWLQCVAEAAVDLGLHVTVFRLNFKGQSIGLYVRPDDRGSSRSPATGVSPAAKEAPLI